MIATSFRFYGQLNDFVPATLRGCRFMRVLKERASVKDAIEAVGVPHPEVDLILVNGEPAGFDYLLQDGDRVAVYPAFRSIDLGDVPRVSVPVPDPIRFAADIHLRKLASYLRLAGFDAVVLDDDRQLAETSAARVVLTRDRALLKRSDVRSAHWIRETDPRAQFVEVVKRFDLAHRAAPFTRCLCCNSVLEPAPKEDVSAHLPPRTRAVFDEFQRCRECGRVYWRGSHYERLSRLLDGVFAAADK